MVVGIGITLGAELDGMSVGGMSVEGVVKFEGINDAGVLPLETLVAGPAPLAFVPSLIRKQLPTSPRGGCHGDHAILQLYFAARTQGKDGLGLTHVVETMKCVALGTQRFAIEFEPGFPSHSKGIAAG